MSIQLQNVEKIRSEMRVLESMAGLEMGPRAKEARKARMLALAFQLQEALA